MFTLLRAVRPVAAFVTGYLWRRGRMSKGSHPTRCRDCGKEWTSCVACHCSECHEHFPGTKEYDKHPCAVASLPRER